MAEKFTFQLRIEGPEPSRVYKIPIGTSTIGRQQGNELVFAHPQVSRRHAQIACSATGCQLMDLGSANGTRLNEEKILPRAPLPLAAGGVIKIGPFLSTFEAVPVKEPPPVETKPIRPRAEALEQEPPAVPEAEVSLEDFTSRAAAPPPEQPPPPTTPPGPIVPGDGVVPPGLSTHSTRLLDYLPGIYHTDFMSRFLALFESISVPIEWNVDNFDLYLSPGTAPDGFLPWLANWFALTFDSTWSGTQRRTLLEEAHQIFSRRGTRWALGRVLEIYTGHLPEIIDTGDNLEAHTFKVRLPMRKRDINQDLVEAIIDANKPAHTTYSLDFK